MEELLTVIAKGLVEFPDGVTVTVDEPNADGARAYHLHVSQSDMGRVIGRQGRIAKAIRTVMSSAASRRHERVTVEID
ncbi:MAG: KH domain-containing protein [Oscillospiraceae bacterium]|jgi:predicted RNA-binding protein YlqC (UPF0109 family)|nr:KH domain-containing protein [Oscillospiraceae bacterium]